MSREKNYYDVLGISKNASQKEIRTQYKKLAKQYHPDRYKGSDAEQKMEEINKAYEVLSNEDKRNQYDSYLRYGHHNNDDFEYQSSDSDGFQQESGNDSFFSNFGFDFGGGSSSSHSSSYSFDFKNLFTNFFTGKDHSHDSSSYAQASLDIEITMNEWFNGVDKKVTYVINEKCNKCQKRKINCVTCGGRGYVNTSIYGKIICNVCNGAGEKLAIKLCGHCNDGVVETQVTKTFKILRFMNQTYSVKNCGHYNIHTQSYGNLIITINVLPHKHYEIQDNDIIRYIDIGLEEFLYGTKFYFYYLDGSLINVDYKPLDDLIVVIRNKGVYAHKRKGHLILKIRVINNARHFINKKQFQNTFGIDAINDELVYRKY